MARILVVEDERSPLEMMARVLREAGHEVRAAASGAEALACIAGFTPDLLLCDWLLEDKTGYEVTLAIRQRVPGVRPLIITGFPPDSIRDQARQFSPWPILEKPVEIDALVAAVNQALASLFRPPPSNPKPK